MNAPFTIFGQTRYVPVKVYVNQKLTDLTEWDDTLWVERGEDWYGLMNSKTKRFRVVTREEWLRSKPVKEVFKDILKK